MIKILSVACLGYLGKKISISNSTQSYTNDLANYKLFKGSILRVGCIYALCWRLIIWKDYKEFEEGRVRTRDVSCWLEATVP